MPSTGSVCLSYLSRMISKSPPGFSPPAKPSRSHNSQRGLSLYGLLSLLAYATQHLAFQPHPRTVNVICLLLCVLTCYFYLHSKPLLRLVLLPGLPSSSVSSLNRQSPGTSLTSPPRTPTASVPPSYLLLPHWSVHPSNPPALEVCGSALLTMSLFPPCTWCIT